MDYYSNIAPVTCFLLSRRLVPLSGVGITRFKLSVPSQIRLIQAFKAVCGDAAWKHQNYDAAWKHRKGAGTSPTLNISWQLLWVVSSVTFKLPKHHISELLWASGSTLVSKHDMKLHVIVSRCRRAIILSIHIHESLQLLAMERLRLDR